MAGCVLRARGEEAEVGGGVCMCMAAAVHSSTICGGAGCVLCHSLFRTRHSGLLPERFAHVISSRLHSVGSLVCGLSSIQFQTLGWRGFSLPNQQGKLLPACKLQGELMWHSRTSAAKCPQVTTAGCHPGLH